jgi:hypothetical protein
MPGFVTVGCKMPNGVVMRGFRMEKRTEPVMGGGTRDVDIAVSTGEFAVIKGTGRLDIGAERGMIASGFALTHNVSADLWENWYAANKDGDMVRNRLIFAHAKSDSVQAQARECEKQRTGLEPLDTAGDARVPKKRQQLKGGAITALETASRAA